MKSKILFKLYWLIFFALLLYAYRNHFDNEFHFDDGHTIQNNVYIRSLDNIPEFFTTGAPTFSTLPPNQLYRPVVTTTLAFDYYLSHKLDKDGNGYNTFYYHLSMFLQYLLLILLLYFFYKRIFNYSSNNSYVQYFAFGAAVLFGIHVTNGETINYIISRSDLLSTLFVILALWIFIILPKLRWTGLYLIPFFLGLLTKQTAAVFLPLLALYYFYFEYENYISKAASSVEKRKKHLLLLFQSLVLILITSLSIYFILSKQGESYTPGGSSVFLYMITQPFVIFHYFISFFIPYSLSADADWFPLQSIVDIRFFIGALFILLMLFAAWKTFRNKSTRPISFGILWFFIALAPTSSIIPLAEVMNDHRMMFPFVGLTISVVWSASWLFQRFETYILSHFYIKNLIVFFLVGVFSFHFFYIMRRVEVWDNGKTLWYDVSVKSPNNGRGLMNYGLQLVAEGKFEEGLAYYKRAHELMPYYNYLHSNMAIAYNAMDSIQQAEIHHKRSVELSPLSHNGYYYYAIFLRDKNRIEEAEQNFRKTMELAPDFIYARYALLEIYANQGRWNELTELLLDSERRFSYDPTIVYYRGLLNNQQSKIDDLKRQVAQNPNASILIELSLYYYQQKNFDSTAILSLKVLEMNPENVTAINNLIASYNNLGKYAEAIIAGEKGLAIEPNNQLLRNNIEVSRRRLQTLDRMNSTNDPIELINLSLVFYQEGLFYDCVAACEKSLKFRPDNFTAYNNICSAYNALQQWEKAIVAGRKAVELDPQSALAQNNLNLALKNIKK